MTAYLTVVRFDSVDSAASAAGLVEDLVAASHLDVDSAATITWARGAVRPVVGRGRQYAGSGSLDAVFWDLLLAVVFFVPLLAAAVGASSSGELAPLHDVGIDEGFINQVRDQVTPGTSALFALASHDSLDALTDAFAAQRVRVMAVELLDEHLEALRAVFGAEA
ncbi:MAG: DUF1269 domain-containing protein [Dermatophilaceae bacterium]